MNEEEKGKIDLAIKYVADIDKELRAQNFKLGCCAPRKDTCIECALMEIRNVLRSLKGEAPEWDKFYKRTFGNLEWVVKEEERIKKSLKRRNRNDNISNLERI